MKALIEMACLGMVGEKAEERSRGEWAISKRILNWGQRTLTSPRLSSGGKIPRVGTLAYLPVLGRPWRDRYGKGAGQSKARDRTEKMPIRGFIQRPSNFSRDLWLLEMKKCSQLLNTTLYR